MEEWFVDVTGTKVLRTRLRTALFFWTEYICCLTFIGPYIANMFAEYNLEDATFGNLFISVRRSTYFFFQCHHMFL